MTCVPVLDIRTVSVSYDRNPPVLEEVSLQVDRGEVFGLIGLNGAGKTTLIKCLLGLRSRYEGEIHILGSPSPDCSSRRKMAYLPEKFEPPWFLSGREFVHFSVELYRRKVADALIGQMAQALALDPEVLDRRVHTYSKGMRQKLGLLATLMSGCDVLVLDEPMSGLDPQARALVKAQILRARDGGATVFFSSHILADVDELCDRIGVIHNRALIFTGSPEALKKQAEETSLERAFLRMTESGASAVEKQAEV